MSVARGIARASLPIAVPLGCLLAACGTDTPSTGGPTVVDSAGVRITLTPDVPTSFGQVAPDPVLQLGGPDAEGPTQFSGIRGITVDAHGNIWVADGATNEARAFRPDGTHWKTIGQSGEGPGEFRQLRLLGTFRGDSLALWDDRSSRLSVFGPDDELVRTVDTWDGGDRQPRAFELYDDGRILIVDSRILMADSIVPGVSWQDTIQLLRMDPAAGARQGQAEAPGGSWTWTGSGQYPIPFTTSASYAVQGEELHVVSGADFRVRVYSDGALTRVYGVDRELAPLSEEAVDTWTALVEEADNPVTGPPMLELLDHPRLPTHLPAYAQLLASHDGWVWARVYWPDPLAGATWDVYAPDGTWQGQIEMPPEFFAAAIHGAQVIGVWYDDFGVEHVRVYRVIRDGPEGADGIN